MSNRELQQQQQQGPSTESTGRLPVHRDLRIDRIDGNWVLGYFRGLRFNAKVFSQRSPMGIGGGRVSKLWMRDEELDQMVFNYDRGMDLDSKVGRDLAELIDRS